MRFQLFTTLHWFPVDSGPVDRGFSSEQQMHEWAKSRSAEVQGFVEIHGGVSDGGHYVAGEFVKRAN